jgi:hypothetical protein
VTIDYRVLANHPQARGRSSAGISGTAKAEYASAGYQGVGSTGPAICKEACYMALESHLAELEKRHEALEQEIAEALTHPSIDDLQIAELKRKKLHVKDEITRLKQETLVH